MLYDPLSHHMYWISAAVTGAFILAIAALVGRYRRRGPGDIAGSQVECDRKIGGPLTLLLIAWGALALWHGVKGQVEESAAQYGGFQVKAQINDGAWHFTYPDDQTVEGRLYLPAGERVQLVLSTDTPHSLLIPALEIHRVLMPGRLETVWFTPELPEGYAAKVADKKSKDKDAKIEPIEHAFACSGLCAPGIEGVLEILPKADFDALVEDRFGAVPPSPEEIGAELYVSLTCSTCHSTDGKVGVGPSFKGLFGKEAHALADGATVKVDEDYIIESIKTPNAKLSKGFKPDQMPQTFGELKPEEYEALIAFIKSVR